MTNRRAYTFIELLVVVGIIALLVGLALPALSRGRERADAALCMSNMRQMITGARLYAHDHNGQLPTAALEHMPLPAPGVGGAYDDETSWVFTLEAYIHPLQIARCPSDESPYWDTPHPIVKQRRRVSYGMQQFFMGKWPALCGGVPTVTDVNDVKWPSTTVFAVELVERGLISTSDHIHVHDSSDGIGNMNDVRTQVEMARNGGHPNWSFVDGHVEAGPLETVLNYQRLPQSPFEITRLVDKFNPHIAR